MLTDDGILVNLSPIRWLQDPLAKYKKSSDYCKFEESVAKHIERLIRISSFQAKDVFGIGIDQDLGIYVIRRSYCDFQVKDNTIISKVMNDKHIRVGLSYKSYKDKSCNNFFPIRRAGSGKKRSPVYDTTVLGNKDYYGVFNNGVYKGMSFEEAKESNHRSVNGDISNMNIVESNNPEELLNIYGSLDTIFMRYLTFKMTTGRDLPINYLPWMGDCTNPRTGLKGYESDWTDDDFRQYFDITDSEWEEIVETMKPYWT